MLFCLSVRCEAAESHSEQDLSKDIAIHTYGGGEFFAKVLNAVSMVIYGNAKTGIGKTFNGLLRIVLFLGGFSVICLAFFREKFDPLIRTFFLPAIGITQVLLIPRTDIYIRDHLVDAAPYSLGASLIKVSNVPYFLAKTACFASSISYQLTQALEGVAHGNQESLYNWTGHIYAGDCLFKAKKNRIHNRLLEENFREFCRECAWRDINLGLYSKDALIAQKDILQFLEENTSHIRSVRYKYKDNEGKVTTKFISCHEAIQSVHKDLRYGGEKTAKETLLGEVTSDTAILLRQSKRGSQEFRNLLKQQAAIDVLKEEVPGTFNSFTAQRAEILQRENQKTLGALGASSIVPMRNFFEAIIYMIFPIIVLVSLLSFGIKPLISWLQFVVWVNVWPPFYVVVNFLLSSMWDFRKLKLWGEDVDLTLLTSEGFLDLYNSMESIAAIAMAFIPFLSWVLIKGGVSHMVHLASSLTSPAQSASAAAASEFTSGSYSLGNISMHNANAYNQEMFKQSFSGRLSQGSISLDQGSETMSLSKVNDKFYVKQSDSYLREGISKTDAFNRSLQDQIHTSESAVQEKSTLMSQSVSESANKALGLMEAFSSHEQISNQVSYQQMSSQQQTFQEALNTVDEYAKSYGLSKDQAAREMMEIGFSAFKTGSGASIHDSYAHMDSESYAERSAKSENFMNLMQELSSFSSSEVGTFLHSQDMRKHQDFVESWNQTQSSVDQCRAAYSRQEGLSSLDSSVKSNSISIHENLNQRFVDFLSQRYGGDMGMMRNVLENPRYSGEKEEFMHSFVDSLIVDRESGVSPSITYENTMQQIHTTTQDRVSRQLESSYKQENIEFPSVREKVESLHQQYGIFTTENRNSQKLSPSNIGDHNRFKERLDRSFDRAKHIINYEGTGISELNLFKKVKQGWESLREGNSYKEVLGSLTKKSGDLTVPLPIDWDAMNRFGQSNGVHLVKNTSEKEF